MNIDDEYIKNEFKTLNGGINRYRIIRATPEELKYITNRYNDSENINESLIRIFNNYEIHPCCPVCGKPLQLNRTKWRTYCSISCKSKDNANKLEQKYGVRSTLRLKEVQEKTIQSLINHYGVDNPQKSKEVQEKTKQTYIKKYGVEYFSQSKEIQEKIKQTCLNKYGTEYYLNSEDCKIKTIIKFSTDNYRKTEECIQLISNFIKNHYNEIQIKKINTYQNHYNVDNPMKNIVIKNKVKETCLQKYGETTWSKSKEGRKILHEILSSQEIKNKINNTKIKNKSFNISKLEEQTYFILKEKYPDIIKQYKDKRYPYYCDLYIPSLDLFIECNYHWTHGNHPYNENNENDINVINKWKEKNTQYYNNAINCWSIRDVNKRKIAKQNKLNYLEFFSFIDFINWYNNKKEVA